MKKLVVLSMLFAMTGGVYAEDNFKVADCSVEANKEVNIEIELVNPDRLYSAVQFDLFLPAGISIPLVMNDDDELVLAAELTDRKKSKHVLEVSDLTGGHYRFLSYSSSNQEYKGNSGALINVTLKASDDIAAGSLTAYLKEVTLTTSEEVEFTPADVNFTITATNSSGISEMTMSKPVDVYDLQGNKIRQHATSLNGLSKGVYIINGKKVVIR